MTNIFYYTDPLAAAWMSKHFRMRFVSGDGAELKWCKEFSCYYHPNESEYEGQCWDDKYFIHQDSLDILKPQKGDIYTLEWYCVQGSSYGGSWEDALNTTDEYGMYRTIFNAQEYRNHRIIQRNGISFMFPDTSEQKDEIP